MSAPHENVERLFLDGDDAPALLLGSDNGQLYVADRDRANERFAADALAREWACAVRPFAPLSVIDYWAELRDAMLAVIEIKAPRDPIGTYPFALLSVRKWNALTEAARSFDCAAVAAFRYPEGVFYTSLAHVDPRRTRVVRRRDRRSDSAVEPVVLIPTGQLVEAGA